MTDAAGQAAASRRRFQPGLWLTLCALAAVAVLVGLGTWQLQRLTWKEGLIAERNARLDAAPIALPGTFERPEDLEFRHVRLAGLLQHDKELHLGGRSHQGQVGFHIVTPLELVDGRTILLDRGWVPPSAVDREARREVVTGDPVQVEAVLRSGGWKGRALFRPDNDPDGNYWIWLDLPAMAEAAGLERPVTALYAQAVPSGGPAARDGHSPVPEPARIEIRNDHLQYALTWYALAVALLVIYVLMGLRRETPGERR